MNLTGIFLLPKEEIIGKKVEFTISDVEISESGEAVLRFKEVPNMIIKIASGVTSTELKRRGPKKKFNLMDN